MNRWRTSLAWGVHAYTATGLLCAAGMAVLIVDGEKKALIGVFWLMVLATLIDATDGFLARLVRVKEATPGFDGRKLDDLIDLLNYVCLPLLLIWRVQLLGETTAAWLLLPLIASAYGFCQVQAKTDDGHFRGFPSYWNIVAFYLFFLPMTPQIRLASIIFFSVLTFVPSYYLYPSLGGRLNLWTIVLAIPWVILLLLTLWSALHKEWLATIFAVSSLYFPAWYLGASWWISLRRVELRFHDVPR